MARDWKEVAADRYRLLHEWLAERDIHKARAILQRIHDGPLLNPLEHPYYQ